jgi:sarcosine oxidase subunit beta
MAKDAFAFYEGFPTRYETRAQAQLEHCGYLFVAQRQESLARLEDNVTLQRSVGVPSQTLTSDQAIELVPSLNPDQILGGSYSAVDGYFDRPQAVVEAFAELVIRGGGRIEIANVCGLRRAGRSWLLDTADGASHGSDVMIVATGYDAPDLLRPCGFELPIVREPRFLFYSEHVAERLLEPLVIAVDHGLAAKHLADGRVLASDLHAIGEPAHNQTAWRKRIREVVVDLLPILEYVSLPILAAGYYDMTPDGQPIVDVLEDGLWVAAGFSGHGFMVAPAVGDMIASALTAQSLPEWAYAVRADRFDAEPTELEAQVI